MSNPNQVVFDIVGRDKFSPVAEAALKKAEAAARVAAAKVVPFKDPAVNAQVAGASAAANARIIPFAAYRREVNYTPEEQAGRNEQASRLRAMRAWAQGNKPGGDPYAGMNYGLSTWRGDKPKESPLMGLNQKVEAVANNTGVLLFDAIGHRMAQSASAVRQAADDYANGLKKPVDVLDEAARSIPLLGIMDQRGAGLAICLGRNSQ